MSDVWDSVRTAAHIQATLLRRSSSSSSSSSRTSSRSSSSKPFIIRCTKKRLVYDIQTNSKQREVRIKGKASVTTGHKQPPWGPTSLLFNGYRRPFPSRQSDRSSTLTIQFHPVPKIKIDCLEVNFHKKAKARGETKACCSSFAFKQINVLGMNPDTSTGADTQERIIITCCQNVNTQFQYIIIVYYCNHTTYLRIHS